MNVAYRQQQEAQAKCEQYNAEHNLKRQLEKLLNSKGKSIDGLRAVFVGKEEDLKEKLAELEKIIPNEFTTTPAMVFIGNGFAVEKSGVSNDFFYMD